MVFIDIHCHLDFESLLDQKDFILNSLKENNILAFTNTMNPENYFKTKEIFKDCKNVNVCPGLYPQDAEKISDIDFEDYLRYLKKNKNDFLAIGEVGLDRHHTKDENLWLVQENRLKKLIELAIKIDKPLILHTRKAEERVLEIIEEYVKEFNFNKFNLHCFTGKKKLINKIKELNIYVSIPLIVKNTQSFRILVDLMPTSKLLVETDSPFLRPGGLVNTPLAVPEIYKEIAEIKKLDVKEVETIIYRNYQKFIM